MTFSKDHFSRSAAAYAAYRATYPSALFAYVAGLVRRRELAWDCATGTGQAALGLADWFGHVVGTDASAAQIERAAPHARVEYRVAPAEASGLASTSVDLVTVAQALHWLDLDAFYDEARRVLAPGGVLAVWAYGDPSLEKPALDAVLRRFNHETVGPYWPAERQLVRDGYRTIPFPFDEVAPPPFTLEREWSVAELVGYLRTWSATAAFTARHGRDPVDVVEAELRAVWGAPRGRCTIRWPLALRIGRGDARVLPAPHDHREQRCRPDGAPPW